MYHGLRLTSNACAGKNRDCTIGPKGPTNHAIGRNSGRIRRTPSGHCAGRDGLTLTRSLNSAYQRTIVNLFGNTLRPSDKTTLGSPHWKARVSFSRTIWPRLRFSTDNLSRCSHKRTNQIFLNYQVLTTRPLRTLISQLLALKDYLPD